MMNLNGPPLSGFVMWSPFCTTWLFDAIICERSEKGPESKKHNTNATVMHVSWGQRGRRIWRTDLSQTTCNFIIITTERAGNWVIQAADCQQPTQSPEWMLATYVSAKHVDMLRLYISFRLNFFFNFTLWQCCAYDLVRFRHKKTTW